VRDQVLVEAIGALIASAGRWMYFAALPFGTAAGGVRGDKIVTGDVPAAGRRDSGGSMTSAGPDAGAGQGDQAGQAAARPVPPEPVPPEQVLVEQSREDTDIAWGDYRDGRDEDRDRLYRDRPPHWADY
jgi:hypothetical protein